MKKALITIITIFMIILCTGCSARKAAILEKTLAEERESFQSQISEINGKLEALQNELNEKEISLKEAEENLKTLTGEKARLENDLAEKETELNSVTEQIAALEEEKSSLEARHSQNEQELAKAAETNSSLAKEKEELQSKWDGVQTNIAELDEANKALQTQIAENNDKLASAELTIQKLSEENNNLLVQKSEYYSVLDEMKGNVKSLNTVREFQKTQLSDKEADIKTLTNQNSSLQEQLSEKETTISALTDEIAGLQAQLSEKETAISTFTDETTGLQMQLSEKETAISALTDENTGLQAQLSEKETVISALTDENTGLQAQLSEKETAISTLTDENSGLQTQLSEKETAINTLTDENAGIQAQLSEKETAINTLTDENAGLLTRLSEKEKAINTSSDENAGFQTQLDEKDAAISTLTDENNSLQAQLTEKETAVSSLSDVNDDLRAQLSEKEAAVSALTDENNSLQTQLTEKESMISTLTEEKNSLQTRLTEAEAEFEALSAEQESLPNRSSGIDSVIGVSVADGEGTSPSPEAVDNEAADNNEIPPAEGNADQVTAETTQETVPVTVTEPSDEIVPNEEVPVSDSNEEPSAISLENLSPDFGETDSSELSTVPAATDRTSPIEADMIDAEELAVRENYTEELSGIEMMYVPAGSFIAGSATGADDEKPQTEIYLDGYWIGRTEVTNAQYLKCYEAGECDNTDLMDIFTPETADYPATYVTYRQAQRFCTWIGGKLPTEFQWEKAARGTDKRIYPWGNELPANENQFANIPAESADLAAVGLFPNGVSPYGAEDMAGNVWEWTSSWYSADTYKNLGENTSNPRGAESGTEHVIRGGSCAPAETEDLASTLRSAYRGHSSAPKYYLGFRCVIPDSME